MILTAIIFGIFRLIPSNPRARSTKLDQLLADSESRLSFQLEVLNLNLHLDLTFVSWYQHTLETTAGSL